MNTPQLHVLIAAILVAGSEDWSDATIERAFKLSYKILELDGFVEPMKEAP